MNKKKWILIILILLFSGISILTIFHGKKIENPNFPILTLEGDQIITIEIGKQFKEPGFKATDTHDGNITSNVTIKHNIQHEEPGTYEITYQITNSTGHTVEQKRFVIIKTKEKLTYKEEYDKIDNKKQEWWSNNKKDQIRPTGGADEIELKKYDAYFQGPNEKVIYLTFDEGSNDTYVKEILETLNQNDVKATFFFCKNYILSNPELMKNLVQSGHSVGNHTANHKNMADYANKLDFQKYLNEIVSVEEAFYKVTGQELDKVYREPRGDWSYRSLQIMKDLGYKTYFWSADYLDWDKEVSKEKALSELLKRYHNGAIYLIHPKSKGNAEALGDFIQKLKNLGYRFDLVKNIKN